MRRLQRRNDPFEPATELKGSQRLIVGRGKKAHPANIVEPGMLGSDSGIIEAGRNRMRIADLPVFEVRSSADLEELFRPPAP